MHVYMHVNVYLYTSSVKFSDGIAADAKYIIDKRTRKWIKKTEKETGLYYHFGSLVMKSMASSTQNHSWFQKFPVTKLFKLFRGDEKLWSVCSSGFTQTSGNWCKVNRLHLDFAICRFVLSAVWVLKHVGWYHSSYRICISGTVTSELLGNFSTGNRRVPIRNLYFNVTTLTKNILLQTIT